MAPVPAVEPSSTTTPRSGSTDCRLMAAIVRSMCAASSRTGETMTYPRDCIGLLGHPAQGAWILDPASAEHRPAHQPPERLDRASQVEFAVQPGDRHAR